VTLKVEVAPDEQIILSDEFKIFEKLVSMRFVVSNKALYLPVLKLVPAWGPYRMCRIPIETVRGVSVRNAIARSRLVIGSIEVISSSALILFDLALEPTPMVLLWFVVLVLGVRAAHNALKRRALVVSLVSGSITSAPPSRVGKSDRERIEEAYSRVMASLRSVGVSVSSSEVA